MTALMVRGRTHLAHLNDRRAFCAARHVLALVRGLGAEERGGWWRLPSAAVGVGAAGSSAAGSSRHLAEALDRLAPEWQQLVNAEHDGRWGHHPRHEASWPTPTQPAIDWLRAGGSSG
jgi:hypothetical protein